MASLEYRDGRWQPSRCRVFWGTHGCRLERGHKERDCECSCCQCQDHPDPGTHCVGKAPWYGPGTRFYGPDVAARGLPQLPTPPRPV